MSLWTELKKLRSQDEFRSFVSSRIGDGEPQFVKELNAALNYLLRTDLKQAEQFVRQAEKCFRYLPEEFRPNLLAMQGRCHHWRGDYQAALRCYTKAAGQFRCRRDSEAVAQLGKGLMDVHTYLGDYGEAIRIGRRSLRFFKSHGRPLDAAKVMTNIGNVYHRMDNNRMALRYYNDAKRIVQRNGGTTLAVVQFNRANVFANLNQLGKARSLYEASAKLYRQAGMQLAEAHAKYSLAYLSFLEDRYTQAIKTFEEASRTFSKLGDPKSAATSALDLVEINIHVNQYGSAIMLGEEVAERLAILGMQYERAKTHYFVGWARLKLQDFALAAKEFQRARALFRHQKNLLWLGMVGIASSKVYAARRRFTDASRAARDAMRYFRVSGDERRHTDAEIVYLETLVSWGKYEEAAVRARKAFRRKPSAAQTHRLCHLMGTCCEMQEKPNEALRWFRSAVTVAEKMLSGLYPDEIRFFFLLDKYESYGKVIESMLRLGRTRDAFVHNLGALATLNRRSFHGRLPASRVPRRLLRARDELRANLKKLNRLPGDSPSVVRAAPSYHSIEQRLWANERRIRSHRYPSFDAAQQERSKMEHLVQHLKPNEMLVSYFASGNRVGAFCASRSESNYVPLRVGRDRLHLAVRKLHFLFETAVLDSRSADHYKDTIDAYLTDLYDWLLRPLTRHRAGDTVILLVDEVFAQVPYAALLWSSRSESNTWHRLRLVPNPDDLLRRRTSTTRFESAKNAIFAVSSDMLPAVDLEAERIKRTFRNARLYMREGANLTNLSTELRSANGFVHIAAHASRSSENPLFSRVLMADGPFFPFDLFSGGVKARLVTLSGCQTAAPGLYYGNSFSLAKAFYLAGSRYVLASLWPVSDKLGMMFMSEFYDTLDSRSNPFDAYKQAVISLKTLTDHPAFWGAFILLGT